MAKYTASCSGNHPNGYGTMVMEVEYNTSYPNTIWYSLYYNTDYYTTWYSCTVYFHVVLGSASFDLSIGAPDKGSYGYQKIYFVNGGSVNVPISDGGSYYCAFTAGNNNSWGPMVLNDPHTFLTIPQNQWKINYHNLNGAENWPENQTINKGSSTTISTLVPQRASQTRTDSNFIVTFNGNGGAVGEQTLNTNEGNTYNYTFKGWKTSEDATTATYQPGASVTPSSDINLYALWQETVVSNGGKVTLPHGSRWGYTLKGWGTSSGATATVGAPGAQYTPTADTTLYAVWQEDPEKLTSCYVKNNSSWKKVTSFYVKNNSSWVSITPFVKNQNNWHEVGKGQ